MARTIAQIQQEILDQKDKINDLDVLTNISKSSIWRFWTFITASAIWTHEKIVERNTQVSRPHTLSWYREQALNFLNGYGLIWDDGFFRFDTGGLSDTEIENKKLIKHCAVSEVDISTIFTNKGLPQNNQEIQGALSNYYKNQVGVIFMKIAGENGSGQIAKVEDDVLEQLRIYMNNIKDAGNQIQIVSIDGDQLTMFLDVYVDPLKIYINPNDLEFYAKPGLTPENYQFDPKNGVLINAPDKRPVEDTIQEYLKNIEFNGALVRTFLIDAIQKGEGVEIPIVKKMHTGGANQSNLQYIPAGVEYFIPKAGYFDANMIQINVNYIPYTFYRDYIR